MRLGASEIWIAVTAISGALAVGLGAAGAHGLRGRLDPEALASWSSAVQYHLVHTLALLALSLFAAATGRSVSLPAALFTAGIALFCGSIYARHLAGISWTSPLPPFGGLCFIAGWLSLLWLARSGSA